MKNHEYRKCRSKCAVQVKNWFVSVSVISDSASSFVY